MKRIIPLLSLALLIGVLVLATPLAAFAPTQGDNCEPTDLRITLDGEPPATPITLAQEGEVILTVLRGEEAAFNNLVGIASPVDQDLYWSKNEVEGTQFNLGPLPAGELIFRITTPENRTYYTGPGVRNPDGLVHANVQDLTGGVFWVGWEDLFNGGDFDYDDVFFQICGDLSTSTFTEIDIKPGSFPNSIYLGANGVIPVAILTTDDFDATSVDPDTVRFGPGQAMKVHPKAHLTDVDDDGDLDMVLHFWTQDTGIGAGDTEAVLTGETFDGTPIVGSDSVRIVPPDQA